MCDFYESESHSERKKIKEKDDIFFNDEMKKGLKKLKKFIKLTNLENEEKLWELNDPLNSEKKPSFMFLRSENKNKTSYEPSTHFCDTYRGKCFSTLYKKNVFLNGFRNYSNYPKVENENLPMNFEDINAQIELKKTQNNIYKNKMRIKAHSSSKKNYKNKILKKIGKIINDDNYNKSISISKKLINNNEKNITDLSTFQSSLSKTLPINTLYKKNTDVYFTNPNDETKKSIINSKKTKYYLKTDNTKVKYKLKMKPPSSVNNRYSNKKSKNKLLFKDIEKQILNRNKNYILRNNQTINSQKKTIENVSNYSNNNSNDTSDFKNTKELITRALNDGDIIKNCIINKSNEINKAYKIDAEEILLKLAERLKNRKMNQNYIITKKHMTLNDEDFYKRKLSKIPNSCKAFFREVYRRILLEARFLNKDEPYNPINTVEENLGKKKLNNQFKKIAHDHMVAVKDNIVTEKDDKELIKDQVKYDYYGNLDGLEWLLTKQNVFGFEKKYIGAYNRSSNSKIKFIRYKV